MPRIPKFKGDFARNVLTVFSGTLIAQAIPVLASPLLTRLYKPEEFGVLALFLSIIAVGSVLATGRFELAIPIPRSQGEAFTIGAIGVAASISTCLLAWIALGALAVLPSDIPYVFDILGVWGYILPLGILLMGINQCLAYWNNRNKRFLQLSLSRVAQSCTVGTSQIIAGFASAGSPGLIGGYVIGQIVGLGCLINSTMSDTTSRLRRLSILRTLAVVRRHADFPKYMTPGQLANVASSQMPVLLLTTLYGPAVAGYYALAERVLVAPSAIISSAIGEVYRQRAAEEYQASGQCRALFLKTAKRLAAVAVIPMVVAALLAPLLFGVLFGNAWRESGYLTSMLSVMVFFQVISSPLSQTILLAKMQRLDMAWQLARLALAASTILAGKVYFQSHRASVILFVLAFSCMYILHFWMQYSAACGKYSRRGPKTL